MHKKYYSIQNNYLHNCGLLIRKPISQKLVEKYLKVLKNVSLQFLLLNYSLSLNYLFFNFLNLTGYHTEFQSSSLRSTKSDKHQRDCITKFLIQFLSSSLKYFLISIFIFAAMHELFKSVLLKLPILFFNNSLLILRVKLECYELEAQKFINACSYSIMHIQFLQMICTFLITM